MENIIKIESKEHPDVILRAIPGHFVTPNAHVNYYLDMTALKCRLSEASAAAKALGTQISATTVVDTIVCIDGCEIIGAFLAEDLTKAGVLSMNAHKSIYVVTPEPIGSGQLLFRENLLPMIKGKNVLLLLASATTGLTVMRATEALSYFGAKLSGVCAVFSAANSVAGVPINSLFTVADLPDYKSYNPEGCSMCKNGKKIDAFANGFGYSKI